MPFIKRYTKAEKAFVQTSIGMKQELRKETSFGEEEVKEEMFTVKIPPSPLSTPPPEMIKPVLNEEDKKAYKQKLRDRTDKNVKETKKEKYEILKNKIIEFIKSEFDKIDSFIEKNEYKTNGRILNPKFENYYSCENKFNDIIKIIVEFNQSGICPFNVSYNIVNSTDYSYGCYKRSIKIYFDWS